jgi:hypothetical protein
MNEKYISASGLQNALQYYNTRAVISNAVKKKKFGGDQVLGKENDIYGLIKLLISVSSAWKLTD